MIEPIHTESLLSQTKSLLQRFDLHAKKRLGQHFLINSGILNNIVNAAEISRSDLILEIGPGLGVLTRELVEAAGWVCAIELDTKLAQLLQQTLSAYSNLSIINRDVLEIEPMDIISAEKPKFSTIIIEPLKYKLIANLPYYITAPIIRHFCEAKLRPESMVLMVQKEVAQNIVAEPGNLGILAISVQFYGKPKIISYVPAGNFYPAPKVDSAILKITLYPDSNPQVISEAAFFKLVRAGFCAARKQIGNSLAQGLDMPKAEVLSLLERADISPQKRAETLAIEDWARLERTFSEANNR